MLQGTDKGKTESSANALKQMPPMIYRWILTKSMSLLYYDGIPFPLQINDGRVHYDGENIGLINMEGTFGSSSFSEFTARIGLGKDAGIEIQSGRVTGFT